MAVKQPKTAPKQANPITIAQDALLKEQRPLDDYPYPSLKLLAHILNDATLSGSNLQGEHTSNTIAYLNGFLQRLVNKQITIEGIEPSKHKQLIKPIKALQATLTVTGTWAQKMESTHQAHVEESAESLAKEIFQTFKDKGRVILPGGWMGSSGHAMMYEFKLDKEGCPIFLIWNTGAGLQFHEQSEDAVHGDIYSPVRVYRCPKEALNKDSQWHAFLQKILLPNMSTKEKYNEGKLYSNNLSHIKLLGAELENPSLHCRKQIPAQHTGTCAWRVLEAMLDEYAFRGANFAEVRYELAKDALQRFMDKHKQDIINIASTRKEFKIAVGHFAKQLEDIKKTCHFSEQREQDGFNLIYQAQHIISLKPKAPTLEHTKVKFINPVKEKSPCKHKRAYVPCVGTGRAELKPSQASEYHVPELPQFDNIDHLNTHINNFLEELHRNQSNKTMLTWHKTIESLLLGLPLQADDSFFVTKNAKYTTINNLTRLVGLYTEFSLSQKIAVPSTQLAVYAATAFAEKLSAIHFKGRSNEVNPVRMHNSIIKEFKKVAQSHYFVLNDAIQNQTLDSVLSTFNGLPNLREDHELDYIGHLCAEHPALCKEANTRPFDTESKKRIALYYVKNRTKLKHKYPQLDEDLSVALGLESLRYASLGVENNEWSEKYTENTNEVNWQALTWTVRPNIQFSIEPYAECLGPPNYLGRSMPIEDIKIRKVANEMSEDGLTCQNQIQIITAVGHCDSRTDRQRMAGHLGALPGAQVVACIEYLQANATQLTNQDIQSMLTLYLFEGDLLHKELLQNPMAIDKLLDLIEEGVRFYTRNQYEQPVAFLVRLNTLLAQYCVSMPDRNETVNKLLGRSLAINGQLFKALVQKQANQEVTAQERNTMSEVLAYRMIDLANQLKLRGKLSQDALIDYFVLNQTLHKLNIALPPLINSMVVKAQHTLASHVLSMKPPAVSMMKQLLTRLGLKHDQVKYDFPRLQVDDKILELVTGAMLSDGIIVSPLPTACTGDSNFIRLIGANITCAALVSHDDFTDHYRLSTERGDFLIEIKKYLRKDDARSIRIYKDYYFESSVSIQHESSFLNKVLPGKFEPVVNHHSTRRFGLLSDKINAVKIGATIPNSLLDEHHDVWVSNKKDIIICDKHSGKRVYEYDADASQGYFLDEDEKRFAKGLPRSCFKSRGDLACFGQFESPKLIEAWKDNQGNITVSLPRYNLSFSSINVNGSLEFNCDQIPGFKLLNDNQTHISGFKNALTLTKPDKEQGNKVKVLLPKQEFYLDKGDNGNYKALSYSINNTVACAKRFRLSHFTNHTQYKGTRLLDVDKIKQDVDSFNHRKSQSYICLDEKGSRYKAKNIHDACQLAYVYLASNQPSKALDALKQQAHQFSGTLDELILIRRIIQDTPYQLYHDNDAKERKIDNPSHLAVQAFALSILVTHLQQGHELDWSALGLERDKLQDCLDKELLKTYLQNLKGETSQLLSKYIKLKSFCPKALQLPRRIELAMLSFAGAKNNSLLLKTKWKFAKLKEQSKSLEALHSRAEGESVQAKSALSKLKEKLKQTYEYVGKKTTQVVKNRKQGIELWRKDFRSKDASPLTIDELNAMTEYEDFAPNYLRLFKEAQKSAAKNRALKSFLRQKINTFASNPNHAVEGPFTKESGIYALLLVMLAQPEKVLAIKKSTKYSLKKYTYANETNQSYFNLLHLIFADELVAFRQEIAKTIPGSPVKVQVDASPRDYIDRRNLAKNTRLSLKSDLQALDITFDNQSQPSNAESESCFSKEATNKEVFYLGLIDEANTDYAAGKQHVLSKHQFEQSDIRLLAKPGLMDKLYQRLEYRLSEQGPAFRALEKQILKMLEGGSNDPSKQISWQADKASKARRTATLAKAFSLYTKGCLSKAMTEFQLSEADATELFALVQQYLLEGTEHQHYQRALDLVEQWRHASESAVKDSLLIKLGEILRQERAYDVNQYPDILLFEYLDNKLVYPSQISILSKLLSDKDGFESVAIQLIMGGGKSKVLLPLLAKLRSTGSNLTVIEVPHALLETNFTDLYQVSQKLGQKAHLFKFNRDYETNHQYFVQLKRHFKQVSRNKEYIVTTRESIQSLELKWIELLTNPQLRDSDWRGQVSTLGQILTILRNQADAVLDEIDTNLRTKDQLIYTLGEGLSEPKALTDSVVDLYGFFKQITFEGFCLFDVVASTTVKPQDRVIKGLLRELSLQLIDAQASPLADIVSKFKSIEDQEALTRFLSGAYKDIPACILELGEQDKARLAVYKEHLTRLLPLSLKRNLHENFGLPKAQYKTGLQREVAIPYISNNTPNESSKFQDHFLTMNYTIQSQLALPISYSLFEMMMANMLEQLGAEQTLNAYRQEKVNTISDLFAELFGKGVSLIDIQLGKVDMKALHQSHQDNERIKAYCLKELILPFIKGNPKTMTSNSQSHVGQYRSVAGFTGTDYNYRCFHETIKRDNQDSFGTDGQTITYLLEKEQQHQLKPHLLDKSKESLFKLLSHHPEKQKLHAIIDVGAHFNGVGNREVANRLAAHFAKDNPGIKYVLYFNEENLLCALPTSVTPEQTSCIVLGSSNNIESKLKCSVNEMFSYYDQAHTTGTDILQAPDAIGLVTVSEKVMLRDILQSVMRLRDLKGQQVAEFAVMPSMQHEHASVEHWDTKTLLNLSLQYQAKTLMQEHVAAAFQKIKDCYRNDLLQRIHQESDLKRKAKLAKIYKEFLVEVDRTTLFDKFSMPTSQVKTQRFLSAFHTSIYAAWKQAIARSQVANDKQIGETLKEQVHQIITKSVKICEQTQNSPIREAGDKQVIAQIEQQNEAEHEQENQAQFEGGRLIPQTHKSWADMGFSKLKQLVACSKSAVTIESNQSEITFRSLEAIAQLHPAPRNWQFDGNIWMSENFYNVSYCQSDDDRITLNKKPAFYVLNINEGDLWTKILLTQREAQELRIHCIVAKARGRHVWIETLGGVPYAGNPKPGAAQDKQHQAAMEQIHFFNADINYLVANHQSSQWLAHNTKDKLDYLKSELLPIHPEKGKMKELLSELMLSNPGQQTQHDRFDSGNLRGSAELATNASSKHEGSDNASDKLSVCAGYEDETRHAPSSSFIAMSDLLPGFMHNPVNILASYFRRDAQADTSSQQVTSWWQLAYHTRHMMLFGRGPARGVQANTEGTESAPESRVTVNHTI